MNYLVFLQSLVLIFILWELLKIFFIKNMWKYVKEIYLFKTEKKETSKKYIKIFKTIEMIYAIFVILLVFSIWWYIGLSLFLVSLITFIALSSDVKKNSSFNKKIFIIISCDAILSIFLLAKVALPL